MSEAPTSLLDAERGLPLVIRPPAVRPPSDAGAVARWAAEHRPWIERHLGEHGALLFRGFPLRDAAAFENVVRALCERLQDYTRGNSPRHAITGAVYSSTDLARGLVIPLHNELSYSSNYPSRIFLFCQTPATHRGETPIADGRRIWRRLDAGVRSRLAGRGVRYIQNLERRRRPFRHQSWPQMFRTDRESEVERICEGLGITTTWTEGGGLRLTNTRPALLRHPRSGDEVWFNQCNVFHRVWSGELRRAGRPALAGLLALTERLQARRPVEALPHHATYGDGSELGDDLEIIRDLLWSETVLVDWQAGDLLMLDNYLAVHGRMPFRGPRRIFALLGNDGAAAA